MLLFPCWVTVVISKDVWSFSLYFCVLFLSCLLCVCSVFGTCSQFLLFHMFSLCMMHVSCRAFVVISPLIVVILLQPLSFFLSLSCCSEVFLHTDALGLLMVMF